MNRIILEDMEKLYLRNIDWNVLNNTKVLVTGAYGMLASYMVYMLIYLNEYHGFNIDVYALGRNENKARKKFGDYFEREYFHFIESDLSNISNLTIFPDYIIHAASFASSQFFGTDPVGTTKPNVLGTYGLLESAARNVIKSMLFVSSGEVYGETNCETVYENGYGISDPLDLRYCYGESKRMGECLCNCYWHQYKVPVKIARLGHTYGPTMDIYNDKRVFSEFVLNAVRSENIVVKSDGSPMRAFCYIADATAAFFQILFNGKNGEAYNVANMQGLVTMKYLAEMIASFSEKKVLKVEYAIRPTDEAYIESAQAKHNVPNTEKMQSLGWSCDYTIEEGFRRTIDSFEGENAE